VRPLAALQTGNIDWSMAQMAQEHGNKRMENEFSEDAQSDYELAVKLNPDDPDSRYKLAVAMENLGHFTDAREQLMVILRDLNHYDARAYNEIGRVILESGPTNMDEMDAAIESFRDAIQLNPNLAEAQRNLALALKMKAGAHATTQMSATMPSVRGTASRPSP
jgi:tetratricopeptide (TPR) repeat protein